jgi:uncharacterized membrane protein HdeD (DUF308 family)
MGGIPMTENSLKNVLQELISDMWWLVFMRGLVILLMGLLLIFRPLPALMVLVIFLGFYWFFDGILTIIASVRGRKSHKDWGWGVIVGAISTVAGIFIFTQPFVSTVIGATFLIYLIGIMILASAIWSIITGVRLRRAITNEWSMILGGILSALFALLLLIHPLVSMVTLVWLIGFFALFGGISLIIIAFRIKKLS